MAAKKPKAPITAPDPDTNAGGKPKTPISLITAPDSDTKAGGKPKTPIAAPKPGQDSKSAPKPKPGSEPGKSNASDNKPDSKLSGQESKTDRQPVLPLKGKRQVEIIIGGARGRSKPRSRGVSKPTGKKRKICRAFLVNQCAYGAKCRFYHPNVDDGNMGVAWFTFCHDFRMGLCNNINCSYFHISREDEERFRNTGEISQLLVEESFHKAVRGNLTLIGTAPCCKNFLRGACNVPDCTFRHINRQEYEYEVFCAIREELEYMTGGPPPFQGQPGPNGPIEPFEHPVEHYEPIPEPMLAPGPPMPLFPDDIQIAPPFEDFESQAKRLRFQPEGPEYSIDDVRTVRPGGGVWEDRDRLEQAIGIDEMRQEIINLRNDNIDLRRDAEARIADLEVDLNRATAENSRLRSEIMEKDTAIKALTATNTTLVEDRRKAQEAYHQLEQSSEEMRRALEMRLKSASAEQGKVEMLHKELLMVKNSLDKSDALIKKTGDENRRLTAELVEARNKIQELHTAHQLGIVNRDVPIEPRWNEAQHPGGGGGRQGFGDRDRRDPGWNRQESISWEQRKHPDSSPWERHEQGDRSKLFDRSLPNEGSWNQRDRHNERDRDHGSWNQRGNNNRDRDRERDRDRNRDRDRPSTWEDDMRTMDMLSQPKPKSDNQPPGAYNSWRENADFSRRSDVNSREANASKMLQQQRRRSDKDGPGGPGKWSPPRDQITPMQQIVNQLGINRYSSNNVPWKYD